MNPKTKLILYVVFFVGACFFGREFYNTTKSSMREAKIDKNEKLASVEEKQEFPAPPIGKKEPVIDSNATAEQKPADPAAITEPPNPKAVTNSDETAVTNQTEATAVTNRASPIPTAATSTPSSERLSHMMKYGAGFFVMILGLGLLIAYDFSRFMGHRAEKLLFNDEGAPITDPEYERAEQAWANGKPLEAVQLMRDYLKKNPREQHVAIRIAEIYEKDLNNPVAAALEYEEVLTKNLPPERWGWAAVHLSNLYSSKLNQPEKAMTLLRRVVSEYGQTAAAEKTRVRLMQADPSFRAEVEAKEAAAAAALAAAPVSDKPVSNLPPGFRPLGS